MISSSDIVEHNIDIRSHDLLDNFMYIMSHRHEVWENYNG